MRMIMIRTICKLNKLPMPVAEYKFHPTRKWRLDYAFPEQKLAIEIEGGVWTRGRHNRGSGFLRDMEKYNCLTQLGWHLLRFTPQQVRDGTAGQQIKEWFKSHDAIKTT
jgi:very-short-patch-repair endonuclease